MRVTLTDHVDAFIVTYRGTEGLLRARFFDDAAEAVDFAEEHRDDGNENDLWVFEPGSHGEDCDTVDF